MMVYLPFILMNTLKIDGSAMRTHSSQFVAVKCATIEAKVLRYPWNIWSTFATKINFILE